MSDVWVRDSQWESDGYNRWYFAGDLKSKEKPEEKDKDK